MDTIFDGAQQEFKTASPGRLLHVNNEAERTRRPPLFELTHRTRNGLPEAILWYVRHLPRRVRNHGANTIRRRAVTLRRCMEKRLQLRFDACRGGPDRSRPDNPRNKVGAAQTEQITSDQLAVRSSIDMAVAVDIE